MRVVSGFLILITQPPVCPGRVQGPLGQRSIRAFTYVFTAGNRWPLGGEAGEKEGKRNQRRQRGGRWGREAGSPWSAHSERKLEQRATRKTIGLTLVHGRGKRDLEGVIFCPRSHYKLVADFGLHTTLKMPYPLLFREVTWIYSPGRRGEERTNASQLSQHQNS